VIIRVILSVLVSLVVGLGTVRAWNSLKRYNEEQIARIAESESYAARSQLIRNVEKMLSALESSRAFWSSYGELPRQQWQVDAAPELAAIAGARTVLWDDPVHGTRFARTPEHPVIDYRPDEAQWQGYESLLSRARGVGKDIMAGPFQDNAGRPYFEIYLLDEKAPEAGRLAAVIDARQYLEALLQDESPGYAVRVSWRDLSLYERGDFAADLPAKWIREGYIRSSLDSLWRVIHAPTDEFAITFKTPVIDMLLLLGLIIAVLMGTLTFENWRAHTRAAAAERAERRLADLNRNLEREIAKRTRELADRTADLQTVTDSVAHDMRNPLSVIATNVQLFEERNRDGLEPEALAPLRRIDPAIRHMAEILDRMLGLSAVAHSTFKRKRLDMKQLATEVFQGLADTEPDPPTEFQVADLPTVDADEKLVKMLLVNLLGNAIKYTRSKERPRIEVSADIQDGVVVYCIRDNGIGFDPRSSGRLFAAFERLDHAGATEGVGLGLAIVARVVERHGGRIWAEGVPGEKAAFYFTLEPAELTAPKGAADGANHPRSMRRSA
jgi:signal transduction histidine kinase